MFYRVTCEIGTLRKSIVDRGEAEVNNGFSRGGHFTCYPTKHCNIFFFGYSECPKFFAHRQLMLIITFMIFKRSPTDPVNIFILFTQIFRRLTPSRCWTLNLNTGLHGLDSLSIRNEKRRTYKQIVIKQSLCEVSIKSPENIHRSSIVS
jgi:hypothetical protein